MTFFLPVLLAAMTSSQAIATLLNGSNSVSVTTYAAASEIVRREADRGSPLQQFVIGVTTADRSLAKRFIESAGPKIKAMAEQRNNSLAWYLLAVEKNNLQFLRRAADGGNVQAMNALGTLAIEETARNERQMSTNAVAHILSQSFKYFSRAAAQQDANAYNNLGACYLRGLGCDIDLVMAFNCFRSAARAGHPEGMDNLSACYDLGHGVARDTRLSLFWRMKARALRGDEAAQTWLKEGK